MSHTYDTTTFVIVPPASSSDDLTAEPSSTYAYARSQVAGEPLIYTWGATRSGWALRQIATILDRLALPALAFLTVEGTENQLPTEGGTHGYTIIDSARQPEVITQFHQLFAQLKTDPLLAEDNYYGMYSDDEIAPALAHDHVSSRPSLDPEVVWGEEGQSADYLFVFLRSILAVIETAQSEGLWVVHELNF